MENLPDGCAYHPLIFTGAEVAGYRVVKSLGTVIRRNSGARWVDAQTMMEYLALFAGNLGANAVINFRSVLNSSDRIEFVTGDAVILEPITA
jgi:uncharacterized protein YbjQ (UPF0145 family)